MTKFHVIALQFSAQISTNIAQCSIIKKNSKSMGPTLRSKLKSDEKQQERKTLKCLDSDFNRFKFNFNV